MGTDDIGVRISWEMPGALIATSPEGHVTFWNPAAEALYGYSWPEARGKLLSGLILARAPEAPGECGEDTIDGTDRQGEESVRRCKDGALIYVYESVRRVLLPTGALKECIHSNVDVTHVKVQRDARLIETRYRELLESLPDAIVIVNDIGRIVFINGQSEAVFGYARSELIGRPLEILMPARYRAAHVGHRADYQSQSRTRPMGLGLELRGLRKNGEEFPVEISLSPLETDVGRLGMSAIRDMTFRNQAEQKFRGLLESAPDAILPRLPLRK